MANTEGWHGDLFLRLYPRDRWVAISAAFRLSEYIPGHLIIGDDGQGEALVLAPDGAIHWIPFIPLDLEYSRPAYRSISELDAISSQIVANDGQERLTDHVFHHKNPILFGGSPIDPDNIVLVPLGSPYEQVCEFWNATFRRLRAGQR